MQGAGGGGEGRAGGDVMFDGGKVKHSSSLKFETETVRHFIWKQKARGRLLNPNLPANVCNCVSRPLLCVNVSCLCVTLVSSHCLHRHSRISNTLTNSPDAQSSSSAPFSQSFSPSHLHDNDTHLLVDPPQSNFSGGHVCMPAGRQKREYKKRFNGRR